MAAEKIGPALLSALVDYRQRGPVALARRARSMGVTGALPTTQKSPRAVVFVRCDPDVSPKDLAAQAPGTVINEPTGELRTGYLPLDQVEPLSDHPAVRRIAATRVAKPRLDVALPQVRIPQLRTRRQLTGAGSLVGIVDTGIDPLHADFNGRILAIWDQVLAGPGVPEGNFGLELTGSAIVASRDTEGHGTHVAGIAAGADQTFGGIAPAADILFVKTDFNTAHIASGVRYLVRLARQMQRPIAINLSLGSHFDAHDGSDDLSAIIDEASGPGAIVCCAAGNEGLDNIHARFQVGANAAAVRFAVPPQSPGVVLSGWYSPNDQLEIAIQAPNGQATPFQGVIAAGVHTQPVDLVAGRVILGTPGIDLASGDNHFEVQIVGLSAPPTAGVWQLLVRPQGNAGILDVWASDFDAGSTIHFLDAVSPEMKIGSPGAASEAVTVASFTTRTNWTDVDGVARGFSFALDDVSPFTSPGPLRKGQQKPDVAAPGAVIASALSADSGPDRSFIINQTMRMDLGTSMATPFITGLVALFLQGDPALTPAQVKAVLKNASRIPQQPASTFQNAWGFGLVNGDLI